MTITAAQDRLVRARAGDCCEYCLLPESAGTLTFHVDHIRPIKHNGGDDNDNLCLACYKCNGYKGDNISGYDPETDLLTPLYRPRHQPWDAHFSLAEDCTINGLTPEGRTTLYVLKLNEESRIQQRQLLAELGMYPCQDLG
jgi:5-methylcytosine-specific restriction endonuclease McrA